MAQGTCKPTHCAPHVSTADTYCIRGGTILAALIDDNVESKYSFSALIRHENQAEKLNNLGVKTIVFRGLDDEEANKKAAAEHDGRHFRHSSYVRPVEIHS